MVRNLQYMKMRSIGKSFSRHTGSRGKQMLNKCSKRGGEDDFVLIDVDSDVPNGNNVIVLDVPESVQKKLRKPSPRTVINIDDDEVADGVCSNDNDSTSASSSRSSAKPMPSKENGSRNHYGFRSECESGSTESDGSDCECMEGPAEELRYQWELASKRRKTANHTGIFSNNQASTSASCPDNHSVPDKENATAQPHTSKQSSRTHMRNDKGKKYEGKTFASAEHAFGNSLSHDGKHDPFDDFAWSFPAQGPSSPNIPDAMRAGSSSMGNNSTKYAEKPDYVDVDPVSSPFSENEHGGQEPFDEFVRSFPAQGPSSPDVPDAMRTGSSSMGNNSTKCAEKPHHVDVDPPSSSFCENENGAQEPVMSTNEWDDSLNHPSDELETKVFDEPCLENRQQRFGEQFDCDISEPLNEDPAVTKSKLSDDSDCEFDRVASMDVDEELPTTGFCSSQYYRTTNSNDDENSAAGLSSFGNLKSTNKVDLAEKTTMHCEEPGIVSLQNHQKPETDCRASSSFQMEAEGSTCAPSNSLTLNKTQDVLQDVGGKPCQNDVLIDRQKIKETDVYKRALEEESTSRQRQLQIQAEEAQRLRRRKKAESMRIMDMERRQKQRLEEVRETQKKDEENLNMKERLRVEIRKKLSLVEGSCKDMASLLRKLGLHVGSDLFPSQNEVQAAYKKALLKFHPDRASRTDIRQQVEAEEKFKLISRMKEKFSSAG